MLLLSNISSRSAFQEVNRRYLLAVTACATMAVMRGCGGGSGATSAAPAAPPPPPAITQQPADRSVPMGLSATYSVTVTAAPAVPGQPAPSL
jgi:hypothetical protein